MERQTIIDALDTFARQRPGMEYGNYGDIRSYRSELRSIGKDLADARTLLRAIELSTMPTATLRKGFRAYSGRLSLVNGKLEYCTGQYFPTEYRKAVCAVCAAAFWDYFRDDFAASAKPGESAGDAIRRNFRRHFGRSIANRWFN